MSNENMEAQGEVVVHSRRKSISTPPSMSERLNLVVCGSDADLKSYISDLILGQRRVSPESSSECVRRDGEVCGYQITLVEIPALYNTQLSEEEVMQKTLRCVSLCDPGVHAFLLIIPEGPLTDEDRSEMQKIQMVFSSKLNEHAIVLINTESQQETVHLDEVTRTFTETCRGGHYLFGPDPDVSGLIDRVKQLLFMNNGDLYTSLIYLEGQLTRYKTQNTQMKTTIYTLERKIRSHSEGVSRCALRIVLLGRTGAGKSRTGNTILRRQDTFRHRLCHKSVTTECQRETAEVNGRQITVIDTPGLFDTRVGHVEIQKEIRKCVFMAAPGPHVFLLVLKVGQRFSEEEKQAVKMIQQMFGEQSVMFTIVLFTGGDLLEESIEEYLGEPGSDVMKLIEQCGHRYHIFNNKESRDHSQVTDLLQKIDSMLTVNGGSFYTNEMFQQVEKEVQEERERALKNRLEEVEREKEELKNRYEEEIDKMKKSLQQEIENERKRREEKFKEKELRHRREIEDKEEQYRLDGERREKEYERRRKDDEKRLKERETEMFSQMERLREESEKQREVQKWREEEEKKRREREEQERREWDERHKQEREKYEHEIEELKNKVQNEEKRRTEEEKKRSDLEERIKELEIRVQEEVKTAEKLMKEHQEEMERIKKTSEDNRLEQEMERKKSEERLKEKEVQLTTRYEEEKEKMKKTFQEEIERIKKSLKEEIENERKRREEEFKEKELRLRREIEEKEEQYRLDGVKREEEHERRRKDDEKRLKERETDMFSQMEKQREEDQKWRDKEDKRRRENEERERREWDEKYRTKREEYEQKIEELKSKVQNEEKRRIEEEKMSEERFKEKEVQLTTRYEEEKERMKKTFHEETERIKKSLKEKWREEEERKKKEWDEKLKKERVEYEHKIKELKSKVQNEEKRRTEEEKKRSDLEERIKELEIREQEEVKTAEKLMKEHQEEMERIKKTSEDNRLEQEMERKKSEERLKEKEVQLTTRYEEEKEKMKKTFHEETEKIKKSLKEEIENQKRKEIKEREEQLRRETEKEQFFPYFFRLEYLFRKLGLDVKPDKKLTRSHFLEITPNILQNEEPREEKDLVPAFMQRLLTIDYRARHVYIKDKLPTQKSQGTVRIDGFTALKIKHTTTRERKQSQIHPMDIQMAVFFCADHFLQQMIISKLSQCQYAVPLLAPNPFSGDIEFPLWTMRQISKSWKTTDTSGKVISKTLPMYKAETPMVAFFRLGSISSSKSQLINSLISEKHHTFFHRNCPGSSRDRLLMDGVVEIAWYLPSGKNTDHFTDCVTFCNLHGDSSTNETQRKILTKMASVNVVLLPTFDENDNNMVIVQDLCSSSTPLIVVLTDEGDDDEDAVCEIVERKYRVKLKGRNQSEVSDALRDVIKNSLFQRPVTFRLEKLAEYAELKLDEVSEACQRGKAAAQEIIRFLEREDPSKVKERYLPCQGQLWHDWCQKNKDLRRLKSNNIELEKSKKQEEMMEIRRKQQKFGFTELTGLFVGSLKSLSESERMYFLKWTAVLLDDFTSDKLSEILQDYDKKWTEVLTLKKTHDKSKVANTEQINKLKSEQSNLENISNRLNAATFGLEHMLREIGQIYEASVSVKTTENRNLSYLPGLAAELMISGHPMELMDGDAAHVPLIWISAVLDELINKLGDQRVFVLSVLGIQSSGKSTMLNAMFGLQFAVSAGRCTRGAFMQLVKVSEEMKRIKSDYILVVDTEGLRALELAGKNTFHHDNELATFVVGLGHMTLINIFGENHAEMQDILQIVVQAFMRMKKVRLNPSCMFVHQNVTDVAAGEKMMEGRRRLQQTLDEMTQLAAKDEVCEAQSFSDVITFDVQNDVKYFSQLWEGNPLMAPPNPNYSENVQELKGDIVSQASKINGIKLSQFKQRVEDLWNAPLSDSVGFKKAQELSVFRKLEEECEKWTWSLRSAMLRIENKMMDRIAGGKKETVEKQELIKEMTETRQNVQKAFEVYFKENSEKKTLIQWENRFKTQIQHLHDNLVVETKAKLDNILKQKNIRQHLIEQMNTDLKTLHSILFGKSKEHALTFKENGNINRDPKLEFDSVWQNMFSGFTEHIPTMKDAKISDDVFNFLDMLYDINVKRQMNTNEYKTIHNADNFKQYVCVNKGKHLTAQDQRSIRELISKVTEQEKRKLKSFPVSVLGYSAAYIQEIVCDVKKEVQNFQLKVKSFEFKNEFFVDLSLYVCDQAGAQFEDLHRKFKEANDPLIYFEKKKTEYFKVFEKYWQGASSAAVLGDQICVKLKETILQSVYNMISTFICEQMRGRPPFTGNRSDLEKYFLKTLAEEEGDKNEKFTHFLSYLHNPKTYFENFIRDKVREFIAAENPQAVSEIKEHIEHKQKSVISAAEMARDKVKHNNGDVKMWLECFSNCLVDELGDTRVHLSSVDSEKINCDVLVDVLKKELLSVTEELKGNFTKLSDLRMKMFRESPDEILIKHFCKCCWEKCPFCGAVCTNSQEYHYGDHSTDFHRLTGIKGKTYSGTQEFDLDFCCRKVSSDERFYTSYWRSFSYKQYRRAGGEYAKWQISPDFSEPVYWKWFICEFRQNLEKYYRLPHSGQRHIPAEWSILTRDEAITSLGIESSKRVIISQASEISGMKLSQFKPEIPEDRKLEEECEKWTWSLRSAMLRIENKMMDRIASGKVETVEEQELLKEMNVTLNDVQKAFKVYFKEDSEKKTLIQWENRFKTQIQHLHDDLVDETKAKLDDNLKQKNIRQKQIEQLNTDLETLPSILFGKSREHALTFKENGNRNRDPKSEFDSMWQNMFSGFTEHIPTMKDAKISDDVFNFLDMLYDINVKRQMNTNEYKTIHKADNFKQYICVNKGKYLTTQDQISIRGLISKVTEQAKRKVKSFPVSVLGYSAAYIQEIVCDVKNKVQDFQLKVKTFEFKKEFFVDLSLYVCEQIRAQFEDLHRKFKEANDPLIYFEKKKAEYFKVFEKYWQGSSSAAVLGDQICVKLKETILQSVYNMISTFICKQMRGRPPFTGNRSDLENHFLKTLAEEEGDKEEKFINFLSYLDHPKAFFENFIRDKVKQVMAAENPQAVSVIKEHIEHKQKSVISAAEMARDKVKNNNGDVNMWMECFFNRLVDELGDTRVHLSSFNFEEINCDVLVDVLKKELLSVTEELKGNFRKLSDLRMKMFRESPDEILIKHFCKCCWEKCPFCGAVCTNIQEYHTGDHKTDFHRLIGINGMNYSGTQEFNLDFCSRKVSSDESFHITHEGRYWQIPYKKYRTVGGEYAKWQISPEFSESVYWKWFICEFSQNLERYYNVTFSGRGEIPAEWRRLTRDAAIASLGINQESPV